MSCKPLSLSCWCVIFTINLVEQRHVFEWRGDGVMFMCAHVFHVALCGNTIRNVALGLWLVGHPCYIVCSATSLLIQFVHSKFLVAQHEYTTKFLHPYQKANHYYTMSFRLLCTNPVFRVYQECLQKNAAFENNQRGLQFYILSYTKGSWRIHWQTWFT